MKNALIVITHPDDLAFGMGGTAWLLKERYKIHVVCILTLPTRSCPVRKEEELAECALLGAECTFLEGNDDILYAGKEICHEVAEIMRKVQPVAVFGNWPIDFHPDHAGCSDITRRAFYLSKLRSQFYMFEADIGVQTSQFNPDIFVDITAVIDKKITLLRCHKSQNHEDQPGQNLVKKATEYESFFRGLQSHCRFQMSTTEGYVRYAEGFKTLRPLVHSSEYLLLDLGKTASERNVMNPRSTKS